MKTEIQEYTKAEKYIKSVLTNDEDSTDEELVKLFMDELQISREVSESIVNKRSEYLKL